MTLRGAVLLALVAAAAVALMPLRAGAVTEAEKMLDITQALTYLAGQQQGDGRWAYGGGPNDVAATGSVLLAFQEAPVAARPLNYNAVVSSGLTYLFQQAQVVQIGVQPWGNPNSTGSGIGVYFNSAPGNHDTYPTGMAIPAIVASGTPGAIVNAPGSAVNGWTYQRVVQETADYLAWGQNDGGWEQGGWGYVANQAGWSDNSNAQWPAVALLYAQPWQTAAQKAQLQFVKTELDKWINTIQTVGGLSDGASDYGPGYGWQNPAKTGGLLVQMDYSQGQPAADVNAAVAYLNRAWLNGGFAGFPGNFGDAYAMWGVYKGLEVTIGLNDTTNITNLNNQLTARSGGPAPLDTGDNWTWWEDYCEYLHNAQLGDGSWNTGGGFVGGGPLEAAWYTNILNATQIPSQVIPEPVTMIGVLAGIGGLVGYVRRRRHA